MKRRALYPLSARISVSCSVSSYLPHPTRRGPKIGRIQANSLLYSLEPGSPAIRCSSSSRRIIAHRRHGVYDIFGCNPGTRFGLFSCRGFRLRKALLTFPLPKNRDSLFGGNTTGEY